MNGLSVQVEPFKAVNSSLSLAPPISAYMRECQACFFLFHFSEGQRFLCSWSVGHLLTDGLTIMTDVLPSK